ncbi:LacI family DNA-binding transcriptional regulator [Lentilactobacillus hilgardii]|uniref:LacI family DNA-binding transcriptional regulator n=1 Tax=Lentilactobacillus hilgardii TaxID=1588 RepID=UPI0021A2C5B4|nr:LacI family DNA-binding transcriptional regulator [Lentilactobacillus hilgardii]MCP9334385.1 LacI family DNA-binding transcriptional regulator [Lentilactobacillus hilgardii]MCP9350935.1 LacI family DNA-binding transcriptional regulator [Lentilactobacillus hilgardii]MCP9353822.1 LacI family DNA-binding transcriptional regulator [Lentilactobacillus hilgardii]MCT3396660.1 LacI family transcriptional regulator [Lentilactobacillus hilgardii]
MGTTIKDIAKLAGVSPATVSRVLSGQTDFYSEKTAKKVKQAVKKLGYQKNTSAVELVTQKSHVLAVIISTIQTNAADQIIDGIQETAMKNGLDVIILYAGEKNLDLQRRALETVIERAVMGILLVAIDLNTKNDALLRSANIPFLFLSIGFLKGRFPFISSDDFQVGYQATKYLMDKGHTKIGFAAADPETVIGQLRLAGYWKALSSNHVTPKLDWVYDGEFTYDDGISAMSYYEQHTDLTAAVASSDLAAIGMLNQAQKFGIRVPNDFAVISIDGTFLCTIMRPQITSVTQSFREMGVKGVETLLSQSIKQFKSLYTPIKITERQSS